MRTIAVLFSLLLCFTVGCGAESSTATATQAPAKLEVVNSTTLDMLIAAKPVILLDFTAEW